jgi:GNAT superfamily N-acetyltransferase
VLSRLFRCRPRLCTQSHGRHLYISFMGVAPALQGQGLGSTALAYFCREADAAGTWMALESGPRSRRLYERCDVADGGYASSFSPSMG